MTFTRRMGFSLLVGFAIMPGGAMAQQDYPNRAITLVVPYAAGGTTYVSVRQLAAVAEKILGQPIVVGSQPGASGSNAMRAVALQMPTVTR